MHVAVVGAGSVGLGTAALLRSQGHAVVLWGRSLSPGSAQIQASGAVEGAHDVTIAGLDAAVAGADVVVLTARASPIAI